MDQGVKHSPRRQVPDQLDTADLDDPMTVGWIETGRLGVEHDLAHAHDLRLFKAKRRRSPATRLTCFRASSSPLSVSMMKSALARLSTSGICRANMAASFAGVISGRFSTRSR